MYVTKEFERVVDLLRFPLIAGVVFIHAPVGVLSLKTSFEILTSLCVPLYFMISGYFFFYRKNFDMQVYRRNIGKRVSTLLIPYLLWNLIALLLWQLRCMVNIGHMMLDAKFVVCSFWAATFDGASSSPIDYPLWFVRDLMVMCLLSPVIYFALRRGRTLWLFVTGILWFFDFNSRIPGFSSVAMFFFSVGAYLSIYGVDPLKIPYKKILYVAWAVSAAGFLATWDCSVGQIFKNLNILTGIPAVLTACAALLSGKMHHINLFVKPKTIEFARITEARNERTKFNEFLNNSAFFIFAFHALIIKNISSCINSVAPLSPAVEFFVIPSVTIVVCLCCYAIARKCCPRVVNILTGNRG